MTIIKTEEKLLTELFQYLRLEDKHVIPPNINEMLIAAITYVAKLKPNLSKDNPLSLREMLCLILLAIGKNPDQCADMLGIKTQTVLKYEQRVRKKLGARNRTHAFYLAAVKGYLLLQY